MRKVARVKEKNVRERWVIVHQSDGGVYVFSRNSDVDGYCDGEDWYTSLAAADEACETLYGIQSDDWLFIVAPPPGCQQDWISPVRVVGRETGRPEFGKFERLVDGKWVRIGATNPAPSIEEAIQQAATPDAPSGRR